MLISSILSTSHNVLRNFLFQGCWKLELCKKVFNPLPNTPFWDSPKFKEAADDNWNMTIKGFYDTDCIEKIADKGENANFEQFHLFPQCFPKSFFLQCIKISTYRGKV